MDINSIENSLVSLSNIPQKISKKSDASTIYNKDEDSFSLYIKDYNKKRDELSFSLQAFNKGIAIIEIAKIGLDNEQKILEQIEKAIRLNNEYNDKNKIKNSIQNQLQDFKTIAYETRHNNEKLIVVDDLEKNLKIEIFTKESYFSIEKPNTPEIAAFISKNINKNDLNNKINLNNIVLSIEKGLKDLNNIQLEFDQLSKNLIASAKKTIDDQFNLLKKNKYNFTDEVNDFSKENIKTKSGYLATSQANIVQDQSIELLT